MVARATPGQPWLDAGMQKLSYFTDQLPSLSRVLVALPPSSLREIELDAHCLAASLTAREAASISVAP